MVGHKTEEKLVSAVNLSGIALSLAVVSVTRSCFYL